MITVMRRRREERSESGFTLIEVLVAMALLAVVLTLAVGALRHFWLVRALTNSKDTLITQLRSTQQGAVSESFPVVYGVRFDVGTDTWYEVRYDPGNPGSGDDTCSVEEKNTLAAGVKIGSAAFTADGVIGPVCRAATSAPASAAFAFFYPRGNATAGNVVLEQTRLGRTSGVEVAGITGRVSEQ